MESLLRCPHCRSNLVIDRDGIKQAPKRGARETEAPESAPAAAVPTRGKPRVRKSNARGTPPGVFIFAACVVCGLALAISAKLVPLKLSGGSGDDGIHELRRAARAFQAAWLAGELDEAQAWVCAEDQPRFKRWSTPRRAGMTAGFGTKFEARITDVEATSQAADAAQVRIAFQIRGRDQQVFQQWKRINSEWRLMLDAEGD